MKKQVWKTSRRWLAALLAASVVLGVCAMVFPPAGVQARSSEKELPSAETIAAMDKYDGREYGIVTPAKDQGSSNLCWVYSTVAVAETAILRSGIDASITDKTLSFNPLSAAYHVFNRGQDPLGNTNGAYFSGDFTKQTGNPGKVVTLFSGWWGPSSHTSAKQDPHEQAAYRMKNAFYIPEDRANPARGIQAIKEAIAKYGAVTFQYNNVKELPFYNPKNEKGSSPHACVLIGWDDNIEANRFVPGGASQKGGWLVKNSYNSCEYFYLSYDNTSSVVWAFEYDKADAYDFNYHYDSSVDDFSLSNYKQAANLYQAKKGGNGRTEYLKAVNVGTDLNGSAGDYTIEVSVYTGLPDPWPATENAVTGGGRPVATKQMRFSNVGFVTVPLDTPIKLEQGEWFSVVARIVDGNAKLRLSQENSERYSYNGSGDSYSEIPYKRVARIKALTKLSADTTAGEKIREILPGGVWQNGCTYGRPLPVPVYTVPAGATGTSLRYDGVTYSGSKYSSTAVPTQAGTYTLTVTCETQNVIYSAVSPSFTISPGKLSYTAKDYRGMYDGKGHTVSVQTAVPNSTVRYMDDRGDYTLETPPSYTAAGEHTVSFQISAPNYNTETGTASVHIYSLQSTDGTLRENEARLKVTDYTNSASALYRKMQLNAKEVSYTHYDKNKNEVLADTLKTGDFIRVRIDDAWETEWQVAVLGDVNGDGKISALDYVRVSNHIMGVRRIDGAVYLEAADVNGDGKISALDYVRINKRIMQVG